MFPRYPIPWSLLIRSVPAFMLRRVRSFSVDAQHAVDNLPPGMLFVEGRDNIPISGPSLVTMNHYSRPGFHAWWLALIISALVPVEIHWLITAGWTYEDPLRKHLVTPLSKWAFQRVADVYGFSTMPPMPPNPNEVILRTIAVRKVLAFVRNTAKPVIGLAPEGKDFEGGRLGTPPTGVGRFVLHLTKVGMPILPVGVYEQQGRLYVHFGASYRLLTPIGLSPRELDEFASRNVMMKIAALLPTDLRGVYI